MLIMLLSFFSFFHLVIFWNKNQHGSGLSFSFHSHAYAENTDGTELMYSDWLGDNKSVNTAENMQKTRKVMSFEEQLMRLSLEIWKIFLH